MSGRAVRRAAHFGNTLAKELMVAMRNPETITFVKKKTVEDSI